MEPTWLLDFGNSRLKVLHTDDEPPYRIAAVSRAAVENRDELFLAQFLSAIAGRRPARAVVAALARPGDAELLRPLLDRMAPGAALHVVSPEDLAPARVLYKSGRPGPDRLANALALRAAAPGAWSVAVDFGTATHLTVVDPDGNLAGGAIMPGLRMLTRALQRETDGRLPELDPFKMLFPPTALGDSTDAAIASGVLIGHSGSVEKLLQQISSEVHSPFGCILATGGGAPKVIPLVSGWALRHEPTLTMDGLRCLLMGRG